MPLWRPAVLVPPPGGDEYSESSAFLVQFDLMESPVGVNDGLEGSRWYVLFVSLVLSVYHILIYVNGIYKGSITDLYLMINARRNYSVVIET